MAEALAEAGAHIVGVSAHLEPDGGEVGRAIRASGREFRAYQCDIRHRSELYRFIERVQNDVPRIDILVNNAGAIRRAPAVEHSDADWDDILAINLTAPFILAREIGRDMLRRGYGKIIFIASLLSFQGGITVPGYAASKGGVVQVVKALANEWASRGVHVNAIAPGYIATDVTEPLQRDPQRNAAILARIPSGRWGRPDDLRGAVVFLASAASDYVDGTILIVDGGWLAR